MRVFRIFLIVLVLPLFVGCSTGKKVEEQQQEREQVESLYNNAADALDKKKYAQAMQYFDEVERQYPYSPWAKQAQLMAAYASYLGQGYDDAILALDRFIELHPGSDKIDYAYYLRALSFYEQISDVRRDQDMTDRAMRAFDHLIRLFPDSRYARDAKLKRDLTLDHLAGKEMEIGRYYLKRDHFTAAINRFRVVVEDFQTTTHSAEALHRLVEAYLSLGLTDEAQTAGAILGYNFQSTEWYESSFALLTGAGLNPRVLGNNWLSAIYRQMVRGEWL